MVGVSIGRMGSDSLLSISFFFSHKISKVRQFLPHIALLFSPQWQGKAWLPVPRIRTKNAILL
jgi:hypothetical protein